MIENRSQLWDAFVALEREPLPDKRPMNGMFDFDRFDEVDPFNHHFDWGPLPASVESDMPDEHVCRAVSKFLMSEPRQPFFCAAGIYKPHLPWHVPQRFFDFYPAESVSLPLVKIDDLDDVPPIARSWALSPPDHALIQAHGQWRHAVQGYLASVSYCDSVIARIVAALDRSAARHNTIIVLWGDNGFHLGEKLHWRKFVLWEEATRVPLIIVPPSGAGPICPRVASPVSLIDLFPTLFDMAGLTYSCAIDGESLLPLLQSDVARRSRPVVSTWGRDNHSIRSAQWRYTRYADGGEELYDHEADPYEWNNVIGDMRFEPIRTTLCKHVP